MATSVADIANLALGHLGIGTRIADAESERSKEAQAVRVFYEQARDEVLRACHWPFATKFTTLGLVEEDPTDEWAYSYRYPTDCLLFRRILSGARVDTRETRIKYVLGQDDDGRLLYTDQPDAEGEYTVNVTDVQQFDPHFVQALACLLAFYLAPQLTGGDPVRLGERAGALYVRLIRQAQGLAFNEEARDPEPESSLILERGG